MLSPSWPRSPALPSQMWMNKRWSFTGKINALCPCSDGTAPLLLLKYLGSLVLVMKTGIGAKSTTSLYRQWPHWALIGQFLSNWVIGITTQERKQLIQWLWILEFWKKFCSLWIKCFIYCSNGSIDLLFFQNRPSVVSSLSLSLCAYPGLLRLIPNTWPVLICWVYYQIKDRRQSLPKQAIT